MPCYGVATAKSKVLATLRPLLSVTGCVTFPRCPIMRKTRILPRIARSQSRYKILPKCIGFASFVRRDNLSRFEPLLIPTHHQLTPKRSCVTSVLHINLLYIIFPDLPPHVKAYFRVHHSRAFPVLSGRRSTISRAQTHSGRGPDASLWDIFLCLVTGILDRKGTVAMGSEHSAIFLKINRGVQYVSQACPYDTGEMNINYVDPQTSGRSARERRIKTLILL